jgi:hypothetical protein
MVGIVGHEGDECRQHDDDGLGLGTLGEQLLERRAHLLSFDNTHKKRMLVLGDKPTATSAMM